MRKPKDLHGSAQTGAVALLQREVVRRVVILSVTLTAAVLATVAFLTRAWFASNVRTKAEGMQVVFEGVGYELAVKGTDGGVWDGLLGSVPNGTEKTLSDETYYATGENTSILWTLNNSSNMNNLLSTDGINPGSGGSMTFYILAEKTGSLTVNFSLQIDGWVEQESTLAPVADNLQDLLRGHVLLFAGFESNTCKGWISPDAGAWEMPIASGTLKQSEAGTLTWTGEVESGKAYPVTIYWIWPEVLGQYLFKIGDKIGDRPLLFPNDAAVDETPTTANGELPTDLYTKMCTIPETGTNNGYFRWQDQADFTRDVSVDTLKNLRKNYNTVSYGKVCSYYNAADQYIGDNVRYLTLRLDTQ